MVFELVAFICAPVSEPAFAVSFILSDCVPFGAVDDAVTVAFVVSETDVFLRL